MFARWEDFYLLVGTSGGALIGIMFVVATLTAGIERRKADRGARLYITPSVFHFGVVLVASAIVSVPGVGPAATGALLAACGAAGLVYAGTAAASILTHDPDMSPDLSDRFFYAVLPVAAYLTFCGGAAAVWTAPRDAPFILAGAVLALLLLGIRNAWDLATFLVARRDSSPPPQ
jgi:hypothetical protein